MSLSEDPLKLVPWVRMDELVALLLNDIPTSLNEYFYWVAVHSFTADTQVLTDALTTTRRIDWHSPKLAICFNGSPEELRPFIDECRARYALDVVFDDHLPEKQWKTLDQLSSCSYTCPLDVRLAPLGTESVGLVQETWVAKYPGTDEHIARFVTHNPSLGVYDIATGELRAWILCNECSEVALLYVTDDHRRKGYAQLLVNALSDQLLRAGIIAQARIRVVNKPSLKLFKTLGFNSSTDTWFVVVGKKYNEAAGQ
ncbi:uncharacterized protein [Bemisia tabaci]|uniref:uncharacterized protein n=1 Tax=Bemisia tabaci TaxID=7038 RepID=UPI0008F9B6DD|nr:PREDICTED: uncharacterized protein LOC109038867 [Bemisia tabaci]